MKIIEVIQGSPEWHAYRCGRVTASRVKDVVSKTAKGEWGAKRRDYAAELICERLTGVKAAGYTDALMQWGIDTEPQAREVYALVHDVEVTQVGTVEHPTLAWSCASPDGLVGTDGLVEIKCPKTATHLDTLQDEKIPGEYLKQMMWQMACTGRAWCDYVSFDPRLPGEMQLYVQRVHRDEKVIAELTGHIVTFLDEVADTVAKLQAKYGFREAA